MKPSALFTALGLAAAALCATAPAHAVGRLLDVNVIDRDSGARLPVYQHDGQWWVAGRPGARYGIEVRNATGARVMGVMSVDGVNVISGDTASWEQSGYVLSGRQSSQITGWRKSDAEVAAFHFTALPKSYAARTGRPDHVGVIGVAVFREKVVPPPPPIYRRQRPYEMAPQDESASPVPQAGEAEMRAGNAAEAAAADAQAPTATKRAAPPAAPRLGTGHGEREASYAGTTSFERRSSRPDEIITIRYDSRENLVALGVIAPYPPVSPRPDAFPEAPPHAGYVPDPPRWR